MKFKNYLSANKYNLITKALVFVMCLAVDLILKHAMADFFAARFSAGNFDNEPVIKGFISLTYTENTGAAFSIFSNNILGLTLFSILFMIAFAILDISFKDENPISGIGFALIMAGAAGNLVDRVALNYVRDFISFDFLGNFPICNFADVCITFGCVWYAVYFLVVAIKKDRQVKNDNSIQ